MSKTNDPHPVRIVLRDWSKTHKANIRISINNTVAEKTEYIPSLSVLPEKQVNVKCTRQVYILPH